ncbi:MAG: methionine--tRNA ligase [Bacilli bacterium]
MKKCYITTPIYYPSGEAHIGHCYCTTMCDVFARYKRSRGIETYFLTGTDEHGLKIAKNAALANKTPQEYVDEIANKFKHLWEVLEISNNDFIRTTEPRHYKVVQEVFSKFLKQDDIYLGSYSGWYCTPCESFWTDTQVGEEHLCPDCGRSVQKEQEESYFFKTNKYLSTVNELFTLPKFVYPESRKTEMINNFIKPGLEDLCVSRTTFTWGIQIKENPKHVIYVWLDALLNYITALGYGSEDDSLFQKFWNNDDVEIIHVVGADISRFHTIYWPMFLKALNLREPDRIFVHGLLMMKDGKMSKSKGNVVSPYPLIEKYGVDALRYYLVREVTFGQNGQFTPAQFVERINNDLVNSYGNLVNRSISMINKYFDGVIPAFKGKVTLFDEALDNVIINSINNYESYMDDLHMTEGTDAMMDIVRAGNKYIDDTLPWSLAKDSSKKEELESVMAHLARIILVTTLGLKPILVDTYKKVFGFLNISEDLNYEEIKNVHLLDNIKVNAPSILFPRLDVNIEVEAITEMMGTK